ncbi:thioesterase family protein [Paecilomyces variotii No. 5]|uniref:Thioesterase family protein n=1 Tax=Byssochlamys spectabilis (strain No. 5 / NBRC 109023) TaxID=1356009 RepID=V5I638_BYSSN|nr:thioesterase family protein [Paecilomyces variotii No. 5]
MFLLPRASRLSSRLRPLASQYGMQISSSTSAPTLSRKMQISAVGYDENSPSSSPPSSPTAANHTPSPSIANNKQHSPSVHALEAQITSHPLFKSLRQNPSFYETRPHETMPSSLKPYHLVAGALAGPAKIPVAPYMFYSKASNELISIFHIGAELCGHPGFVHGGLLSVMFDEVFARLAMPNFKSKLGVTANLSVDYRAPARPGEWYALKSRTVGVEGRKAWVEGKLEMLARGGDEEGVLVAEGKSLFVEPKFADVSIRNLSSRFHFISICSCYLFWLTKVYDMQSMPSLYKN